MQEFQFWLESKQQEDHCVFYLLQQNDYIAPVDNAKKVEWIAESFKKYLSKIEEKQVFRIR